MVSRIDVERKLEQIRLRVAHLRSRLEDAERSEVQLEIMLVTGEYRVVNEFHFPRRGTQLRQVLEIMVGSPDAKWGISEIMILLGHDTPGSRRMRQAIGKFLIELLTQGWVTRPETGQYALTKAATDRLSSHPR